MVAVNFIWRRLSDLFPLYIGSQKVFWGLELCLLGDSLLKVGNVAHSFLERFLIAETDYFSLFSQFKVGIRSYFRDFCLAISQIPLFVSFS